MSQRKFAVGDRVAAYHADRRYVGTVHAVESLNNIKITMDTGYVTEAHPKQCRKLVKKKPERRENVRFLLSEIDRRDEALIDIINLAGLVIEDLPSLYGDLIAGARDVFLRLLDVLEAAANTEAYHQKMLSEAKEVLAALAISHTAQCGLVDGTNTCDCEATQARALLEKWEGDKKK